MSPSRGCFLERTGGVGALIHASSSGTHASITALPQVGAMGQRGASVACNGVTTLDQDAGAVFRRTRGTAMTMKMRSLASQFGEQDGKRRTVPPFIQKALVQCRG